MDYSKLCYIPFHGLAIDPSGYLTFCCMDYPQSNDEPELTRWFQSEHINDVNDIEEWWQKNYKQVWNDYTTKDISSCFPCSKCFKGVHRNKSTTVQESFDRNLESGKLKWVFTWDNPKIRFLEFTTSNICNQMCVMCNSRYSTQWYDHGKDFGNTPKFDTKLLKINDQSVDKIKKLLPQLSHIMIKGGEPLADMTNLELLDEYNEREAHREAYQAAFSLAEKSMVGGNE